MASTRSALSRSAAWKQSMTGSSMPKRSVTLIKTERVAQQWTTASDPRWSQFRFRLRQLPTGGGPVATI
jgi:hypothetical protein